MVPSTETRPLLPHLARSLGIPAGLPVCAGAAGLGAGGRSPGRGHPGSVAYVWGTSTVILGAGADLTLDPERRCLVTPLAIAGWGVEMDLVSTGAAVAWLARLLGFGPAGRRTSSLPRRPPPTRSCPSPCRSSASASRGRSLGRRRARHASSASTSRTAPRTWRARCSTASSSRAAAASRASATSACRPEKSSWRGAAPTLVLRPPRRRQRPRRGRRRPGGDLIGGRGRAPGRRGRPARSSAGGEPRHTRRARRRLARASGTGAGRSTRASSCRCGSSTGRGRRAQGVVTRLSSTARSAPCTPGSCCRRRSPRAAR